MHTRSAEDAYRRAMRDYIVAHEHLLVGRVNAKPGSYAGLALCRQTPAWQACSNTNLVRARDAARCASLHAMLCLAAKPDWFNMLEIEGQCHRKHALMDGWQEGASGLFSVACSAFNVRLPAPPPKPPKELGL